MSDARYARVRQQIEAETREPSNEERLAGSVAALLLGASIEGTGVRRRDLAVRIAWLIAVHAPCLDEGLTVILPLRLDMAVRGLAPLAEVLDEVYAAEVRVRPGVVGSDWSTGRIEKLTAELGDALASRVADPSYLDRAIDALVAEPYGADTPDAWRGGAAPRSHRRPSVRSGHTLRCDVRLAFVASPGVANDRGNAGGTDGCAWVLPWAWMRGTAQHIARSVAGRGEEWLTFLRALLRDRDPRTRNDSVELAVRNGVVARVASELVHLSACDPDEAVRGKAAAAVLTLRRTG